MNRTTLVAASVLLLLAGYVYWLERDDVSDDETVFDVEEDDIVRVEVITEVKVVIERRDGSWRIVAPIDAATDSSEVDMLLENLATMGLERSIARDEGLDVREFGLDAPRLEVRFATADGAEQGLRFGKDTLTPASQYAQRVGETDILVLASYLSNNLSKSLWELRDKAIFHIGDEAEAKRISMTRRDGALELVNEGGLWYVATPPRARADRYEATGIVTRFRRAEMVDLVAEAATDLTVYGLDPPERVLHVELDKNELVLEVGRAESLDYYARTPSRPHVFLIESGLVEDLEKTAEELWSHKLFDASVHQITRFQIDGRRVERETTNAGDLWKHDGGELDTKTVEDLLYKLTGTDAQEIVESAPVFEPGTVITIWTESTSEEISVGPLDGDVAYAKRKGDDVALALSSEKWDEIDGLLALEPRKKD